jgi:radical SAM protein with 4Fe4S-binding SPASM domain
MPDSNHPGYRLEHRRSTGSSEGSRVEITVKLVAFDPGLPLRSETLDPDSQCDCACFAVEGKQLPILQAPVSFYLELTPFCNSHCPSCGNVFVEHAPRRASAGMPSPLSAAEWRQLLDKIRPYALRLKLTGGEPTIHPQFGAITAAVDKLRIPFTLITNGRWSGPDTICTLFKGMAHFQGFLVSLHGSTAASHEAFTRVKGSFAETLSNIRAATDAGLSVSLSCIITRRSWHQIDEILETAREIGANSVVFNRYLGLDTAGLAPAPGELQSAVQRIRTLRTYGAPVKLGNCVPECLVVSEQAACLAGVAFFTVDPWGRVRPCNHAPLTCGDLRQQTVDEIWHSPGMEQWRKLYPLQCQHCDSFTTCGGGCRAQAMVAGQDRDPLMTTPHCVKDKPHRVEWALYEKVRPVGQFVRRPEKFGTLLMAGNRLMPVGSDMTSILDRLDGHTTLEQISAAYGANGLSFVASLYQQGMIDLRV